MVLVGQHLLDELLRRVDVAFFARAVHLVPHDLAPVRAVLVRLHDGDFRVVLVIIQEAGRAAVAVVDDGDAAPLQLVARHDHAQRRERRLVVLDDHAVVHAEHGAVLHVPPAHGIGVRQIVELGTGHVNNTVRVLDVAAVALLGHVGLEPEVVVVVLVVVREDEGRARFAVRGALVRVGHGRVES